MSVVHERELVCGMGICNSRIMDFTCRVLWTIVLQTMSSTTDLPHIGRVQRCTVRVQRSCTLPARPSCRWPRLYRYTRPTALVVTMYISPTVVVWYISQLWPVPLHWLTKERPDYSKRARTVVQRRL